MTPGQIVLIILAAILLIPWIIQLVSLISLKRKARATEAFLCKNLRYIVYITGQVRSGKTTFQAGYANIRTKDLISKAQRKIDFICLAFPEVPFDCVEKNLQEDFEKGSINSDQEARKLVADGMILSKYRNLSYNNRVSRKEVPFIEMLSDYIDAKWALYRNNYVYYYGKAFHSMVTDNDAMDYDPSMLNIKDINIAMGKKDSERKNDYHLLPYSIIAEDEKQISGKDNTRFMSYSKADTGSSDCLRLIGQLGEETIFYSTTNQYWGTDINRERELATEIVSMRKSTAINPYFMPMFLIRCWEAPKKFILNWKNSHCQKDIRPLQRNSKIRNQLSNSMFKKKALASKGYVIFNGLIYHNPADYGKRSKFTLSGVDNLFAVIPLKYCYGSINTFQFHAIQKELISKSRWELRDEPKTIQDAELADRVLSKRAGQMKKTVPKTG
ncbi:MAG: hypothetical protein WCR56_04415 [Bacilli bacterium]